MLLWTQRAGDGAQMESNVQPFPKLEEPHTERKLCTHVAGVKYVLMVAVVAGIQTASGHTSFFCLFETGSGWF